MKKIDVGLVTDNFVKAIGQDWMLITAGTSEKFNTMTASWGGVGYLWNKPVAFVFVRPERYTFEFTEAHPSFTLSFLEDGHRDILNLCGAKSGRDIDKVAQSGLIPLFTDGGNVTFEQSRLTLECRTLYTEMVKKENFMSAELYNKWYNPQSPTHKLYVAEIVGCWSKE